RLSFYSDDVADISPVCVLKGLVSLQCRGSNTGKGKLADLTPIRGLPLLTGLDANCTQVEDLGPLRGMPLRHLFLQDSRVTDLSPLKGMRLEMLAINGTGVKDLSPLKDMPLSWLWLDGTPVSDLSPLRGMPLKHLSLDYRADFEEVLRSLTTLEKINGKSPAEFWKEMDSK